METAEKYENIIYRVNCQSTEPLVGQNNAQSGKRCWASVNALHDTTFTDTYFDKGVDVSVVYDERSILSFREHVVLNEDLNKLYLV